MQVPMVGKLLTIKSGTGLAAAVLLLAAGGSYASQNLNPINSGTALLAFPANAPIEIFSGDRTTLISSGDTIDFGTVELDYWGKGLTPTRVVYVRNTSTTPVEVEVTGDLQGGVLPLFGPSEETLKPWPHNGFELAPSGDTGDMVMGWLGLEFLDATTSSKSTTIIFRATATVEPHLLTKIDFEDPSLGQLERFSDAMPLRNQYLQSHGVSFRGDTPTSINGLAVLHKSSGFGIGSHGTGDYFFAGIDGGSMLNGGNPFLPEAIDFVQGVTQVWLYGCSCGGPAFTMTLEGYDGPGAAGSVLASESHSTSNSWQLWSISAPSGSSFRSVKLSHGGGAHTVVVDDLEWRWAGQP